MWKVLLHPNVRKFLDKQEEELRERIEDKLKELEENPFRYLEHYEGEDYYKFRVGDYRALIDVEREENVLKVQVLDHRSRIYRE